MMHPSCLMKVEEYIKDKDDVIKYIIRNLCDTSSTELRMENLLREHVPFVKTEFSDGRIKSLLFSNFRTYPKNEKYGLSFTNKDGDVSSLFLVGKNGAGKSTVYTALEKIYKGNSSYATLMSKNHDDYLTYAFGQGFTTSEKNWALHYDLVDKGNVTIDRTVDRPPLAVPAFFCSDLDVQRMKEDKNLFLWVLEQMGYGHLQECLQIVSKLLAILREMKKQMSFNSFFSPEDYTEVLTALLDYDHKKHDDEIKAYSENIEVVHSVPHQLFKKKWTEIERLQPIAQESVLDGMANISNTIIGETARKALSKLYNKLYLAVKECKTNGSKIETILQLGNEQKEAISEIEQVGDNHDVKKLDSHISYLETTVEILKNIQRQLVSEFIEEYAVDIQDILSEFSGHEEKFEFETLGGIEKLDLKILVNFKGVYETSPHEYFNEFRFKLYCVTMKIAIAYNWMLKNQVSVPIVIDDVFNANDFDNSIRLEQYAYFLKKAYNDKVLLKKFDHNLQLILLTHDQLVLDSLRRGFAGLKLSDAGTMQMDRFPFKAGIIYCLEEIDEYYGLENNMETDTFSIYQDENRER